MNNNGSRIVDSPTSYGSFYSFDGTNYWYTMRMLNGVYVTTQIYPDIDGIIERIECRKETLPALINK